MARLALSAEPQVQGQPRDQGLHRVLDVFGRDPLPCPGLPGQHVAGLLPHVGQVHRVDPVRDAPGAAHVLPFHAAVEEPCFSWPVSSSAPTVIRRRRDRRAAASSPADA